MTNIMEGATVVGEVRNPIVEITPALAHEWLQNNPKNRSLRRHKVEHYARAMTRGEWRESREPIEFDTNGNLVNGQHRLEAVVKSGITIRNPIRNNVPSEEVIVMDSGMPRTASDVLAMSGDHTYTAVLAAAAKAIYAWENYPSLTMLRRGMSAGITNELIAQIVKDNPGLQDSVIFSNVNVYSKSSLISPSATAAIHYRIAKEWGSEIANRFFEQFAEGYDLERGSPLLALRNILTNQRSQYSLVPAEMKIAWATLAFNKWVKGEHITILRYTRNQDYPQVEPKPVE